MAPPFPPAQVEIALVCENIEDVRRPGGTHCRRMPLPSVTTSGCRPQAAELALDTAISKALPGQAEREDGILAQFGERGIIHGERGQVFFLSDPRADPDGGRSARRGGGHGLSGKVRHAGAHVGEQGAVLVAGAYGQAAPSGPS